MNSQLVMKFFSFKALMKNVKTFFRFCVSVFFVLLYVLSVLPLYPLIKVAPFFSRKIIARSIGFYSRLFLLFNGIKVKVEGEFDPEENYLVIANHMSYLDILFLSQLIPMTFVTSLDMKRTIGLGQLTELGGCLYVDRSSRDNLVKEVAEIINGLKNGLNVVVFPEATSTNGDEVKRFKRPLFQSAISAKKKVLPISINYEEINGKRVTSLNRDYLCWYGDMGFLPHLWNLMKLKSIKVSVKFSPAFESGQFQDTTSLAGYTHKIVSDNYKKLN